MNVNMDLLWNLQFFDFNIGNWLSEIYDGWRFHIYLFYLRIQQQKNYIHVEGSKGLMKKKRDFNNRAFLCLCTNCDLKCYTMLQTKGSCHYRLNCRDQVDKFFKDNGLYRVILRIEAQMVSRHFNMCWAIPG